MNKRKRGNIIKKARSVSRPFIACLKDCKETHCFMSLSKFFQILVPLYANVRWPVAVLYIEDTTRWREDMNFMFEWQEQYLTSKRSERVRYCSCHENIKFISSSQRVMFFLLYGD